MRLSSFATAALWSCYLARHAVAHPLCYFDARPTDPDEVLEFCPAQDQGACCNDLEEQEVIDKFNAAGSLSAECSEYYKEWMCGICNAYSGHFYELLGDELGTNGLTMKSEFCEGLVSECSAYVDFSDYADGSTFCEKHVGGSTDKFWSYPYTEPEIFEPGLQPAFPNLASSSLPSSVIVMHMTPDGSSWWIAGQDGQIVTASADDPTTASPVVDISAAPFYVAYEEGLLDFAFSPMFDSNNLFYISYTIDTDAGGRQNRLSKFTYTAGDATATYNSEEVLLDSLAKSTSIHSGGFVGFKPSDYGTSSAYHDIYWAIGDGGPQLDTEDRGQDTSNILASIVRISVPSSASGSGYEIPSGNYPGGAPEICAPGFRNPYRCGFDRETDELYCGDVGHTFIEEIDIVNCGENYGWHSFEGSRCHEAAESEAFCSSVDRGDYTFPIYEYCHSDYYSEADEEVYTGGIEICGDRVITGRAVIAGFPYRGQQFSDVLMNSFVFGDYNTGQIYYLTEEEGEFIAGTIISDGSAKARSFAEDNGGELYVILDTSDGSEIFLLPCGDLCATTCLTQAEELPEYTSLGCFADSTGNRALQLQQSPTCDEGEDAMSPAICAAYCSTIDGASLFGVEFGKQCFCGTAGEEYDKNGEIDTNECSTLCSGSGDMTCGGYNAIEVFEIGAVPPSPVPPPSPGVAPTTGGSTPTPSTPVGTEEYDYVGCFADVIADRALSADSTKGASMSTATCATYCLGYAFFGTQYSTECFCGGPDTVPDVHGEGNCNYACAGDDSETCGGFLAMSVYEYTDVAPSPTPPSGSGYAFVGCIADDKANRVLKTGKTSSASMTAEVCSETCLGSTYFGTQFKNECWCGDESSDIDTGSATCDLTCTGDSSEICGGYNALSLYEYDSVSPTPTGSGGGFVGCYADSKTARIMGGKTATADMTSAACATICSGSAFYGTQFGNECWCGADGFSVADLTESTACTYACVGDSSETCGGYNAMSVYEVS